jgi:hypothetical protein
MEGAYERAALPAQQEIDQPALEQLAAGKSQHGE